MRCPIRQKCGGCYSSIPPTRPVYGDLSCAAARAGGPVQAARPAGERGLRAPRRRGARRVWRRGQQHQRPARLPGRPAHRRVGCSPEHAHQHPPPCVITDWRWHHVRSCKRILAGLWAGHLPTKRFLQCLHCLKYTCWLTAATRVYAAVSLRHRTLTCRELRVHAVRPVHAQRRPCVWPLCVHQPAGMPACACPPSTLFFSSPPHIFRAFCITGRALARDVAPGTVSIAAESASHSSESWKTAA